MENKIQELTDKIYREGVEKGNAEAQDVLEQAKQESLKLIEKAQEEADSILKDAKSKAEELMSNTKSEIKLYADQSVNSLKTEVTDLLLNESITSTVKAATSDANFLNQFILSLAEKWSSQEEIVISTEDATTLKAFFSEHSKDLLDKGVTITEVNGIDSHFTVSPKDGSYKVNFGDEEFINYFKAFLRPQLVSLLFGDNK